MVPEPPAPSKTDDLEDDTSAVGVRRGGGEVNDRLEIKTSHRKRDAARSSFTCFTLPKLFNPKANAPRKSPEGDACAVRTAHRTARASPSQGRCATPLGATSAPRAALGLHRSGPLAGEREREKWGDRLTRGPQMLPVQPTPCGPPAQGPARIYRAFPCLWPQDWGRGGNAKSQSRFAHDRVAGSGGVACLASKAASEIHVPPPPSLWDTDACTRPALFRTKQRCKAKVEEKSSSVTCHRRLSQKQIDTQNPPPPPRPAAVLNRSSQIGHTLITAPAPGYCYGTHPLKTLFSRRPCSASSTRAKYAAVE